MTINNRYRPRHHFTAPQNWMNDPNGLVHWKGRYHLYYQHNPGAAYWGDMHWGHAVSTNLIDWEHLPIALYPDQKYDQSGVYSGIALNTGDEVKFFYTGVNGEDELPCLATDSSELLLRPTKAANNPLFDLPEDVDTVFFRDHAIAHHNNTWFQVIGSGIRGEGGNCMLYSSTDLESWEFVGPLVDPSNFADEYPEVTGWECPDFFKIGDTWVLIVSHWNIDPIRVWAYTGTFDGYRFVPQAGSAVDLGSCFYAPQSFMDDAGRRIQIGWLKESRPVAQHTDDGWAGAMSLPRELFVRDNGTLGVNPVQEVLDVLAFSAGIEVDPTSCAMRIRGDGAPLQFDLDVLRSPDGAETTHISAEGGILTADSTSSALHEDIPGETFSTNIGDADEILIFVDRSIIEIFVAGEAHSLRVYPEHLDESGFQFQSDNGNSLEMSSFSANFSQHELES